MSSDTQILRRVGRHGVVVVVAVVIGDVDDTFRDGDGDVMDVDRRGAKDDRRHADRGRP